MTLEKPTESFKEKPKTEGENESLKNAVKAEAEKIPTGIDNTKLAAGHERVKEVTDQALKDNLLKIYLKIYQIPLRSRPEKLSDCTFKFSYNQELRKPCMEIEYKLGGDIVTTSPIACGQIGETDADNKTIMEFTSHFATDLTQPQKDQIMADFFPKFKQPSEEPIARG